MGSSSNIRIPSIIALVICAILWLVAPFTAINIITLGNQPTALQFITDDITFIGEITETPVFWAAVFSMGGIIVCFFCDIIRKPTVSRIVAAMAEIPMIRVMFNAFRWADGDMEDLFNMLGIGFWGIFLLFLVVILANGKKVNVSQVDFVGEAPAESPVETPVESPIESPTESLVQSLAQSLYCSNCGAEIKPGIKFCAKCGKPIAQEQHKT